MKYIKSIWKRILVSLIIAGLASAFTQMATGEAPESSSSSFRFTAILAFIVLTAFVMYDKYKYFFSSNKAKKDVEDDDILDSDI